MEFDFSASPKQYASITYKINWMLDPLATSFPKVENLNDFREARKVINKIKQQIRNEYK